MQATAYTYDAETRSGSVLLDDGTPVPFDARGVRRGRAEAAAARAAGAHRGGGSEGPPEAPRAPRNPRTPRKRTGPRARRSGSRSSPCDLLTRYRTGPDTPRAGLPRGSPARRVSAFAPLLLAGWWSSWRWWCGPPTCGPGPSSPSPSWPPGPSWRRSSSRWPWSSGPRSSCGGLLGRGLLRGVAFLAVVFFAGVAFLAVAFFAVAFFAVAFLAAAFLVGKPAGQAALGRLLDRDLAAPRELLRAAHQVLEALARTEAGNGGLLDPNPLTRLRVAGVTGRAVDLLEGTETGDRDPVPADDRADDGVQDRVDRLGGLLTAADLVGNSFYELRLVHVFPFGDIARTKVFRLFRTLGRYIPQIKHETG